jgi:hypothetical protein
MAQMGEGIKAGASAVSKVYKILWLITIIGFIVTLGGFYLEFRRLNDSIADLQGMVNTLGEQVVGAAKWSQKLQADLEKEKEQSKGLLDKLGK